MQFFPILVSQGKKIKRMKADGEGRARGLAGEVINKEGTIFYGFTNKCECLAHHFFSHNKFLEMGWQNCIMA